MVFDDLDNSQKKHLISIVGWLGIAYCSFALFNAANGLAHMAFVLSRTSGPGTVLNYLPSGYQIIFAGNVAVFLVLIAGLMSSIGLVKSKKWARVMSIKTLWALAGVSALVAFSLYSFMSTVKHSATGAASLTNFALFSMTIPVLFKIFAAAVINYLFTRPDFIPLFEDGEYK